MSDPLATSSPYRATKPAAPADLVVPLRESGSTGYGGVVLPLIIGVPVAWMVLSNGSLPLAGLAIAVAAALSLRAILRLPPSRATFSVRSGSLVVRAGRRRTMRAPLDDVWDVRVSARVLRGNSKSDIPAFAVGPMAALANQQVDRSVGVIEVVLADPEPAWRPTDDDERTSHLDEVARTIRLHLRKHGWKPPDERAPIDAA